jgi:hypothetical protein
MTASSLSLSNATFSNYPTDRSYVLCAINSVVKQTIKITFADDLFLNNEHFLCVTIRPLEFVSHILVRLCV